MKIRPIPYLVGAVDAVPTASTRQADGSATLNGFFLIYFDLDFVADLQSGCFVAAVKGNYMVLYPLYGAFCR